MCFSEYCATYEYSIGVEYIKMYYTLKDNINCGILKEVYSVWRK